MCELHNENTVAAPAPWFASSLLLKLSMLLWSISGATQAVQECSAGVLGVGGGVPALKPFSESPKYLLRCIHSVACMP